jgi:nucleoside-diphosphate-sugar epimerase
MIIILGAGYAGRFIYAHAIARGVSVTATSRVPKTHLDFAAPSHRLEFDLDRPITWRHIPAGADIVWCFPAMPLQGVQAFAEAALRQVGRVVVLGSTSAYETADDDPDAVIDESSPIDRTRPRVIGEEYLRTHAAAMVLRVAGIYGPGRNVVDWIRRGKVGPSTRYVNLIHVEDLAAICLRALEKGRRGESYNVSDGNPRRWSEICDEAQKRWAVVPVTTDVDQRAGKRLSIEKLAREFHYRFQHPDLYQALETIESSTSGPPHASPRK